jgi:AraC-like DNA-binding protein
MVIEHKKLEFNNRIIFESVNSDEPESFSYLAADEACFVFVQEGNSTTFSPHNVTEISEGNFSMVSSGNLIIKTLPGDNSGIHRATIIHFPRELVSRAFSNQLPAYLSPNVHETTEVVAAKPCVILSNYMKGINLYIDNPQRFNEDILLVKIREILLLLLQSGKGIEISALLRSLFAERTNSFKATVDTHLFNNISIEEMAILANMSLSTFKRKFREIYDDTPANYILSKKLDKAHDLLSLTELSVSEITYEIGFKTVHHLSRKFKERFGESPSKFRMNLIDKKLTPSGN